MEDLQRIKKLSGLHISEEATDAEIQDKGSLDGSPGTGISVDDMIISMVTESQQAAIPTVCASPTRPFRQLATQLKKTPIWTSPWTRGAWTMSATKWTLQVML